MHRCLRDVALVPVIATVAVVALLLGAALLDLQGLFEAIRHGYAK